MGVRFIHPRGAISIILPFFFFFCHSSWREEVFLLFFVCCCTPEMTVSVSLAYLLEWIGYYHVLQKCCMLHVCSLVLWEEHCLKSSMVCSYFNTWRHVFTLHGVVIHISIIICNTYIYIELVIYIYIFVIRAYIYVYIHLRLLFYDAYSCRWFNHLDLLAVI